jgi:hypothetical protein
MCEKCVNDKTCDECGAEPGEPCEFYCTAPYGPGGPHEHDDDQVVVPLAENLAATPAARAALPDTALPHPGDPVVIYDGHVLWLTHPDPARPADDDNTLLHTAPVTGSDGAETAEWTAPVIGTLNSYDVATAEHAATALRAAWDALIEHADTPAA